MRISARMVRGLGWCACVIGASAAPFIVFARLEGEEAAAAGFFLTAAAGLFVGGLVLVGTRRLDYAAGAPAALRLGLYGWLLTPLLAAPPLAAASGSGVAGAFEAYSALTTTGAVLLRPEDAPASIVLWRCWLAWLGGLASVMLAATVFAALDRRGPGLRRSSLLTVERSDLFTNFGRAARRLGGVYAGLTVAGVLLLAASGAALFDALCLALSGVATAGLAPHSGPLSEFLSAPGIVVMAALCLLGAWNIAVQYEVVTRYRFPRAPADLRAMIATGLAAAVIAAATAGPAALAPTGFDALFAVTTAGYSTSAAGVAPPTALLILALVGGSTISTAGGLKMPRLLLLARRAAGELSVLSHPSAAVRTRFAGRTVSDAALTGVWVYALAFPIALGLGAWLIGVGGADFDAAWRLSAAALSNAGPLGGEDWSALSSFSLLIGAALMVVGRLEVLGAAAAVYAVFARD